jgi:hypothetical protein
MALEYKFVELSIVTDETIEEAVNTWVQRGWMLDGIRFVATEASRRPQMAFVSFTREIMYASRDSISQTSQTAELDQTAPRLKGPRLVKDEEDTE